MRYPIILLPVVMLAAVPVQPQGVAFAGEAEACGKRSELLDHLAGRFAEQPIARGSMKDGSIVEILASPDGQRFTVIRTTPNGISCLLATGNDWDSVKERLVDPGA